MTSPLTVTTALGRDVLFLRGLTGTDRSRACSASSSTWSPRTTSRSRSRTSSASRSRCRWYAKTVRRCGPGGRRPVGGPAAGHPADGGPHGRDPHAAGGAARPAGRGDVETAGRPGPAGDRGERVEPRSPTAGPRGGGVMARSTRRNALRRVLLFVGGLVGAGRGGGDDLARGAGLRPDAVRAGPGDLRGRTTGLGPARARGADHLPRAAARRARRPPRRRPARRDRRAPGPGVRIGGCGAMEWHTFHLPGGTIIGSGTAGSERGEFAILGGTGRYANARGTYTLGRGGELVESDAEFVLRIER